MLSFMPNIKWNLFKIKSILTICHAIFLKIRVFVWPKFVKQIVSWGFFAPEAEDEDAAGAGEEHGKYEKK